MTESLGYRVLRTCVLTALAVYTLFPLVTLVITSLTGANTAEVQFRWTPANATVDAFVEMWRSIALLRYLLNSLFVSSVATLISVLIGVLAAHAILRYRFAGKRPLVYVILATQTFPGILFLLPLFVLYVTIQRSLGIPLDGSYLGLIITFLSFSVPFAVWLLVGYLEMVPKEMEEAAMVDGCRALGAFFRVTLRIAAPGIAAVAVFVFISDWGEVLFASVLTTDQTRTIPIGLEFFENAFSEVQWNQLMAAAIVASAPLVAAFLWLQRYFVRGLAAGAVK